VNAQENYFAAPQEVDKNGHIIGHTHIAIKQLKFAFFKGVNDKADGNGQVHVPVTAGLKEGVYRLSAINSAANHQPVLVSVAQHGSLDDAIYVSRFPTLYSTISELTFNAYCSSLSPRMALLLVVPLLNTGGAATGGAVAPSTSAAGFALKNGQDAIALNKKFAGVKNGDVCTDTAVSCAGGT
jgi:hypothetical protein